MEGQFIIICDTCGSKNVFIESNKNEPVLICKTCGAVDSDPNCCLQDRSWF